MREGGFFDLILCQLSTWYWPWFSRAGCGEEGNTLPRSRSLDVVRGWRFGLQLEATTINSYPKGRGGVKTARPPCG
jgi:hypothetical protein